MKTSFSNAKPQGGWPCASSGVYENRQLGDRMISANLVKDAVCLQNKPNTGQPHGGNKGEHHAIDSRLNDRTGVWSLGWSISTARGFSWASTGWTRGRGRSWAGTTAGCGGNKFLWVESTAGVGISAGSLGVGISGIACRNK